MRLDKLLANQGFGSRKDVKKLAKKGQVLLDGKPVKDLATHVDPYTADLVVGGKTVHYQKYVYIMLNKPAGVISATEDVKEKCVTDLIGDEFKPYNLFPVGRLDKNTTGLLLLTNDGQLAHQLTSPNYHAEKVYEADILGKVTEDDVKAFEQGVTLDDGYVTKPAKLSIIRSFDERSYIEVSVIEGKFHQIKRMFLAVGKKVLHLHRRSMKGLELDTSLTAVAYRVLSEEELDLLRS